MRDAQFDGISDEELADIWYALSGAEIRHTDRFTALVDASLHELEKRRGHTVREFLEQRFAALRAVDAPDDAVATLKARALMRSVDNQS